MQPDVHAGAVRLVAGVAQFVSQLLALGLLGLLVEDDQAERARQLIAAYNGAEPLPGDEPESYPGELIC